MKNVIYSNRLNKYIVKYYKRYKHVYVGSFDDYSIACKKLMESKENFNIDDDDERNYISFNRFQCNRPKLKIGSFEYVLYHVGLEGQNAYYNYIMVKSKKYYVELVNHPKRGWSYHIERYGLMIHDSLISNTYFDNKDDAHKKVISLLLKK
jgi:hypothetical protein